MEFKMNKKTYKMCRILIIIFLIVSAFSTDARQGIETVYLQVNGLERYYKVYLPKDYDGRQNYPLVFILHGGGGKASGMMKLTRNRFNQLADRDGFIAVYPNGYKKSWNDGDRDTLAEARRLNIDDVGFFDAIIHDLNGRLSVDNNNIFACGISNGGFMVQKLALERSSVFKAIGVISANMSEDQQEKTPENPVSVLFICGTADPLVPYNGGPVVVLKQKRGEVVSVDKSVHYWKEQNQCNVLKEMYDFPDLNKADVCTAHKSIWQNPENPGVQVVNIRIENGGHTWPGGKQYLPRKLVGNTNRDINACDEIWSFFESFKSY